jgi:hypothetical protein
MLQQSSVQDVLTALGVPTAVHRVPYKPLYFYNYPAAGVDLGFGQLDHR